MYSTTKCAEHSIFVTPLFEDRRPGLDATIWRISLSPTRAFTLVCDLGHLYHAHEFRPRVGAMLEADGAWTIYLWSRFRPDSALLLLLLDYGAARLADASRWCGECWLTGDLLYKTLAVLAHRDCALPFDGWDAIARGGTP